MMCNVPPLVKGQEYILQVWCHEGDSKLTFRENLQFLITKIRQLKWKIQLVQLCITMDIIQMMNNGREINHTFQKDMLDLSRLHNCINNTRRILKVK